MRSDALAPANHHEMNIESTLAPDEHAADAPLTTRPVTAWHAFVIGVAFVIAYVLLAWIARFYLVRPFSITPWNPAAGLALAFLLVFGIRYWPALAVASIATTLLLRGIPGVEYQQLLAPLALTAGYVAMAALLRGPLRFRLAFDRPSEIIKLVLVAAVGTLLIALVYVALFRSISSIGSMTFHDYRSIVLRFWIGHLIGIAINTPFCCC